MKVLFAVSNDSISEAIIKRYPKEYRELLSYKNVYYFNAILKEIQNDKSYDRIVISEDLEPFVNTNNDSIDNFIFDHLDKISDEASGINGKEVPIILICSERRSFGSNILNKFFSIGIYNALLGKDRNMTELCKLINKPRTKKEAKLYYRIDQATYDPASSSGEVSESEIQNILNHFKKLGKSTDRYADSFNNIAAQYTDDQLKLIVNVLPIKVKAVLEEESEKYQSLMGTQGSTNRASQPNANEPGIRVNTIGNSSNINGPIVIPSGVKRFTSVSKPGATSNIQNINTVKVQRQANVQTSQTQVNNAKTVVDNKPLNDAELKVEQSQKSTKLDIEQPLKNVEPKIEQSAKNIGLNGEQPKANIEIKPEIDVQNNDDLNSLLGGITNNNIDQDELHEKRGRGRPRKPVTDEEEKPKGKRGRPRKDSNEEDISASLIDNLDNIELPGMDEINDTLPGIDDDSDSINEILPSEAEDNSSKEVDVSNLLAGLDDNADVSLPGLDDSADDLLPGLDDSTDDLLPGLDDSTDDALPGLDDSTDDALPGLDDNTDDALPGLDDNTDDALPGLDDNTDDALPGLDDSTDDLLPGLDDNTDDALPGLDDNTDDALPGLDDNTDDALPGLDDNTDDALPGLDDSTDDALPGLDDSTDDLLPGLDERIDDALPGLDDNADDVIPGIGLDNELNKNDSFSNANTNAVESIKPKIDYSMSNLNSLLSKDKKIVTFLGTTKNGTSFLVNNLALMFSLMGINTAILDMTQNRNSYYLFTDSREELRQIAYTSLSKLENGYAEGIKFNKNLTVYTSLPSDGNVYENAEPILSTLVQNHSLILIDCDFNTPPAYFASCQEIYLVQSMDILTIQPLTAFIRDLKFKGAWEPEKARVVINKETSVRVLNNKMIIGGMSRYNGPDMSVMTDLFNKDMVKACSIPFDEKVYSKYLETMATCKLSLNGYPKQFMSKLQILGEMVYPRLNGKKTYEPSPKMGYGEMDSNAGNAFSSNTNNILNKMKSKY